MRCASKRRYGSSASSTPNGASPLSPGPFFTHHLDIWNGDVKVLREVGVPNKANIGQEHAPQVALVGRQVPHALDLLRQFQCTERHRQSHGQSAYENVLGLEPGEL